MSIPTGSSTVKVSLIDTGARIDKIDPTTFFTPKIAPLSQLNGLPALCFLIEHGEQRYLFDLALRKDISDLPPAYRERVQSASWETRIPDDVPGILRSNHIDLASISGIVWRRVKGHVS